MRLVSAIDMPTLPVFRSPFSVLPSPFSLDTRGSLSAPLTSRRCRQAELLDAVPDLIPVQAKEGRCTRLVAGTPAQGLNHQVLLQLLEIEAGRRQLDVASLAACLGQTGEIAGLQPVAVRQQHR